MKVHYDYVVSILDDSIVINCVNNNKELYLKKLGACRGFFKRDRWILKYCPVNRSGLAIKLEKLRDAGFYFAGAAGGWPPAAVFDLLREQGYVDGKIIEIVWRAPGEVITREI